MRRTLPWLVAASFVMGAIGTLSFPLAGEEAGDGNASRAEESAAGRAMRDKLVAAERVLEGLVTEDFGAIEQGATELRAVARHGAWGERARDPVFGHFNAEFQRLTEQLAGMGRTRNLEGAAYVHQQLVASCIACHQHVRDVSRVSPIQPVDE